MIKMTVLLTRRSDLSHEEFIDYWTQQHTPMIAKLPSDEVTVRRYVQLYPTKDSIPGVETTPVDGVAELWVDSVADAAKWFTSETYTTVVADDEDKFLDRSKTRFIYATEEVIFG
jgi:uncharacterized protein (TIGR02118 family)